MKTDVLSGEGIMFSCQTKIGLNLRGEKRHQTCCDGVQVIYKP